MVSRLILSCFALHCFFIALCHAHRDCDEMRAGCLNCTDPMDNNLFKSTNRKCREVIGHRYVWRNLNNCDSLYYLCEVMPWNCEFVARRAGMKRRLS